MRGFRAVTGVFEQIDSPALRGLVVFLPMVGGDDEAAARTRTSEIRDSRIATIWDPGLGVGRAFRRPLGLRATAWDVYLVYPPGVVWEGDAPPPPPTEWMHQLWELWNAHPDRALDPDGLREMVQRALPTVSRDSTAQQEAPSAHAVW